jgi:hypothetical protein
MKTGNRHAGITLTLIASFAGLALSATAQLTTPPPQKPAGWPQEVPVAPVQTKYTTVPASQVVTKPAADGSRKQETPDVNTGQGATPATTTPATTAPAATAPTPTATPTTATGATPQSAPQGGDKPTMTKQQAMENFTPWERDGSGRVLKLDRPLQWAAIDRNRTVTPEVRKKIEVYLAQRRTQVEDTILKNMGAVRILDSGDLEVFSMSDRANLTKVNGACKPFLALGTVPGELKKADLFTANNIQQHQLIVDGYRRMMLDDMKRDAGDIDNQGKSQADLVARAMFLTIADEARQVYYWMLEDSAQSAIDHVSQLGLSPEVETKVREAFTQAKTTNDEAQRLQKMREGVALLTPEQTLALVAPVVKHSSEAAAPAAPAAPAATTDATKPAENR